MKIASRTLCLLLLWGCAATPAKSDLEKLVVPSEEIIQVIAEDATNPQRTWGEFRGHSNRVVIVDKLYSENLDHHVILANNLDPERHSKLQWTENMFDYLGSGIPKDLGEIVLRLRGFKYIDPNKAELIVQWAFSSRICGSDRLTLSKQGSRWRVTASRFKSIC